MWEYSIVYVPDSMYEQKIQLLNAAGTLGWEFTGTIFDTGHGTEFLMKCRKNKHE